MSAILFSESEFQQVYQSVYNILTRGKENIKERRACILGGQPGAGKSTYYKTNPSCDRFICINGDDFRAFCPKPANMKIPVSEYAEMTQPFVNRMVETLIYDLSSEGYNIIIEGTLRDVNVPLKTCRLLNQNGYVADLAVIACDAEQSWKATIDRVNDAKKSGSVVRTVPIEKYDYIIEHIAENTAILIDNGIFNTVKVMDRAGKNLYTSENKGDIEKVMTDVLNIDVWKKNRADHKQTYDEILESLSSEIKEETIKETENDGFANHAISYISEKYHVDKTDLRVENGIIMDFDMNGYAIIDERGNIVTEPNEKAYLHDELDGKFGDLDIGDDC